MKPLPFRRSSRLVSGLVPNLPRREALQACAALGASLWLPPARACEYFGTTLRVLHPWVRASGPAGRTVALCMSFDQVTQAERLIGAETPVAGRIELAGPGMGPAIDLALPADTDTVLSEAGIHLRLLDLQHALELGRSYPLLLTFEKAGSVRATLNVDYARFG